MVQVLGNVYSSYSYMLQHNPEQVKYFTDSVLFYLQDPDPQVNQVMVSYITGAILPIVSLCMTSMVVNAAGLETEQQSEEKNLDAQPTETEPVEEISKIIY